MKKALIRMSVNILTNVSECPSWYGQDLVSPARILYLSAYLTTGPTVYRFQESVTAISPVEPGVDHS
jgi:hypothetical protein